MPQLPRTVETADEPDLQVLPFSSYAMIIDARTETEFQEDHVPGAVNLPVVDQPEFAEVGTLHKSDTHAAYMIGVAYAMRRMADHVERVIKDVSPDERILVYCFRGGKRSKLWADNLRTIGFRVDTIKGGWKNYRR
ncbi:MAG: tRNA 2-selenouridine(34) synthase MnmH, partial [Methylibium sp.]|uniref:rhodanese-like domain-containing protein n=1 Tax=Methylibium sp. TaxID=2067992 RepID=UPI0018236EF0